MTKYKMLIILHALFFNFIVLNSYAGPCPKIKYKKIDGMGSHVTCLNDGRTIAEILFDSGRVSQRWVYDNRGYILSYESFNSESVSTQKLKFEHLKISDLIKLSSQYSKTTNIEKLKGKKIYKITSQKVDPKVEDKTIFESYVAKVDHSNDYNDQQLFLRVLDAKTGQVQRVDFFDDKPKRQELVSRVFGAGQPYYSLDFEYFDSVYSQHLSKVTSKHETGKVVWDYSAPMPEGNSKRIYPVVIIDSGFDVDHKNLKDKLWFKRPYGWAKDPKINLDSENIRDTLFFSISPSIPFPFSHGTHVSDIALRNTLNHGLVGFAGDYSIPSYLSEIAVFIKENNVPFSNMSLGFGDQKSPFASSEASRQALEKLIEVNPQTLFVVAAANDGMDLDDPQSNFKQWPASISFDNVLTIAALDIDDLGANNEDFQKLENAQLTEFSNRGIVSVDIAAPGFKVKAANIANGIVPMSGTSMATPWALNVLIRAAELAPEVGPHVLSRILMMTAYVPKTPLPVKSGGSVFEQRFFKAVQYYRNNSNMTQAALQARKDMPLSSEMPLDQVLKLQKVRGIEWDRLE